MKKFQLSSKSLITFAVFVLISLPLMASAAGLIPCNRVLNSGTGKFDDPCNFSTFVTLGNNLVNFLLFKFATPFAVILFMWAGFLFMFKSNSEGDISKAKNIFWNVFIGFIIALSAFLIVKLILLGLGANIADNVLKLK